MTYKKIKAPDAHDELIEALKLAPHRQGGSKYKVIIAEKTNKLQFEADTYHNMATLVISSLSNVLYFFI